ncbi:hypothetical protein [Paractinoplanes lichenicola]|uniref:Lipoprotein n=1 Tax=Paractinoplanes lichenicola TaxID=2802976 RepID=A0ABS1VV24_9ACTN|nr:hypothetical protein [Actinoplanes lichenicola]MBL7258294.1 hypothetical protein [Actinoplanes lichenicola]
MRIFAVVAIGVLLTAGCRSEPIKDDKSGASSSSAGKPTAVDCAHDIGGRPPDDDFRLILDAVALPTAQLQASDSGEPGRLFAKTGLLVRAGTAVELTVDPSARGVTIGWGSPGPEGTTIRVPACPNVNGWLAFAGGYHVPQPMCVPLIVRANGSEQRAEVRVGADCD